MPAALRWSLAIFGWTLLISTDAFFRGVAKATGGESAVGAGLRGVVVCLLGYLIWKWVKLSGKAPSTNQVSTTSVDERPATRLAGAPANISVTGCAAQSHAVSGQTDDATDTGALVPPAKPIRSSQSPQTTTGEIPSMEDTEDRIYAQVGEEIESGNTDKGIWTRAFSQAGGDDKQTRVLYIQSRVAKLLAIESAQNEARLAVQQAEVNEQERLKRVSLQLKMGAIGGGEANGAVSEKLASSFLLAVRNGAIKQVERMIKETPILLAVRNKGGDTCLHIAARENHTGLINLLAEHGAYANASNDEGKTARDIASSMGFPATAGALGAISASVCPHCYSQIDSIGVTLCPKCYRTIPQLADERRRLFSDLVLAAKEGNLTGITTILEKDRMLVSETDSNGYTALHHAATGKSPEVIKALITAGADIKHTHHFGKTAFEIASADMKPFLT